MSAHDDGLIRAGGLYAPRGLPRSTKMAKLVTGDRLLEAVRAQGFVKSGLASCAEGAKYDFRMGSRLLKFKQGNLDTNRLTETERSQLTLEPGEIAFVLTEETLDLPNHMIATLSPKRKLSHDGILVLGGFFIDPLYHGPLLVGLYNFSTTRWPLRPGRKLIAAVFYALETEEMAGFGTPESITDFPDDLVRMMQMYQPVMLQSLQELIAATQRDIADLRKEFRDQEDWKRTFRESLERHDIQIDKLLSGLKELKESLDEERKTRQADQVAVDHQLTAIGSRVGEFAQTRERRRTFWIATVSAVTAAIVGAVLGAYLSVKLTSASTGTAHSVQPPAVAQPSAPTNPH
jgi:deoxycytidine triphosphate deaminase